MGDRPESYSWVRMSEDKVRRKDWCWSVRVVLVLVKLPVVSGPSLGEAGCYRVVSELSCQNITVLIVKTLKCFGS